MNTSPKNADNLTNSTAYTTFYKGKNDKFTEGFMNFMYRDNSIFAATKYKNKNTVILGKLK